MLRKAIRKGLRLAGQWLYTDDVRLEGNPRLVQNSPHIYPYLNALHLKVSQEAPSRNRPNYLWGALHGVHLAKTLGIDSVSLIEFGVAGGNGLVSLERIAEHIERILGVNISVYGFDTGVGLPPPKDVRDCPNLFAEGQYPMDVDKLRSRLRRAELILGNVEETVPAFITSGRPNPVAFISFDLDFYTSTKHALRVLEGDANILLPRIHCYFDDITGFTYGDHNGERLAIAEFNQEHQSRKISPIYALRHYVATQFKNDLWVEKCYMAHILDHDLYGYPDGLASRAKTNDLTDLTEG